MLHTLFFGYPPGFTEGLHGCGRQLLHLVAREEPAEMERVSCEAVVLQPAAHAPDHVHVVVDAGDDEVGDLYPDTRLVHGQDGVEHRLQVAAADALVDIVAERLQVDVGGIEPGQQVCQRLLTHIPRRDEDVPQPFLVGCPGAVRHIFYIGKGFGVGISHAGTMVLQAEVDHLLGRELVVVHGVGCNLRYLVVLTVQAAEITSRAGHRQTRRAGMEVIERLLLNGVDGQRTGLAVDLAHEHPVVVTPTPAQARLPVGDAAVVRAEQALHPVLIHPPIIPALHRNPFNS